VKFKRVLHTSSAGINLSEDGISENYLPIQTTDATERAA
jgi:hypothetical protein